MRRSASANCGASPTKCARLRINSSRLLDQYNTAIGVGLATDPLPAGVSVEVSNVEFWQPNDEHPGEIGDDEFASTDTVQDADGTFSCRDHWVANPNYPANDPNPQILAPKADNRLQRVTVSVHADTYDRTLVIVKRIFQ